MPARRKIRGHSLLEVVILMALLGIVAMIAIPRFGRGTDGAAGAALAGDLRVLRDAIDHYHVDHGGSNPTLKHIAGQLTLYTDYAGDVQATRDKTHLYGPYLGGIPPLPVGLRKGARGISDVDGVNVGWIYDEKTGAIKANDGITELEAKPKGKLFR